MSHMCNWCWELIKGRNKWRSSLSPSQLGCNNCWDHQELLAASCRVSKGDILNASSGNANRHGTFSGIMAICLSDHIYCVLSVFTHLGLWRRLYDCSRHYFRARKSLIERALLTLSSISNHLAAVWKGEFYPRFWGIVGHGRLGIGQFDSPPMGSY